MPVGLLLAAVHVGDAGLGGDREAGRHPLGAEHARHLGDVGALAAEQLAHVARALGEVVDPALVGVPHGRRILRTGVLTERSRTWAWCSSVSRIARSAWASARGGRGRGLGERAAERLDEEVVGRLVEPERARLAGGADDAAGGAGEAREVLALAAGGAGARAGARSRRRAAA